MSTEKPDGIPRPSVDTGEPSLAATLHAGTDTDPAVAAASIAATSSSRSCAPVQNVDVDELRAERVRLQERVGGAHSGMVRAAAVASRSADEQEERRKRRREANTASKQCKRAAAKAAEAASEAEAEGASDGSNDDAEYGDGAGESEIESEGEGESELDEVEAERQAHERMVDQLVAGAGQAREPYMFSLPFNELERRVAEGLLSQPGDDQAAYDLRVYRDRVSRGVPLGEYLLGFYGPGGPAGGIDESSGRVGCVLRCPGRRFCPHGFVETSDWKHHEGGSYVEFSSVCANCLGIQLAQRACEAAIVAAAPDDPDDPPDPCMRCARVSNPRRRDCASHSLTRLRISARQTAPSPPIASTTTGWGTG